MATENATPEGARPQILTPARAAAFKRYGSSTFWVGGALIEFGLIAVSPDIEGGRTPDLEHVANDMLNASLALADLLRLVAASGEHYPWTMSAADGIQCLTSLAQAFLSTADLVRKDPRHA